MASAQPKVIVLEPGEGPIYSLVGDKYTIKVLSEDAGGSYSLIEAIVPPQAGPPPHIHLREIESFYILEGLLELTIEGAARTAGPGSFVQIPPGTLHHFRNVSDAPARMLVIFSPGGFEGMFVEIGKRLRSIEEPADPVGPEQIARLVEAAPRYSAELRIPHGP